MKSRKLAAAVTEKEGMTLPRRVLPNTTYLVTRRCMGRRFLLRPDALLNQVFVYCLARAAEKHGVEVHAL
ncbi:MAG TPA: transposase, partial [Polyangiales bacterium]|nr:transposase [Polyangiales bacterium]